jgi:glutathione synthase/RimK-type ligase-like ATP-grasp enzyme
MTILVLGSSDDEHAIHVCEHLCRNGAHAVQIDCAWFPDRMTITFDPQDGDGEISIAHGDTVAFREVTSVYWRNYDGAFATANLANAEQNYIAENDSRSLFESLLVWLPVRWVNSWGAIQLHQTKPAQLAMVAKLGIPIPRSLITNAPGSLLDFVKRNDKSIFKPVQGGAHARRLTPAQLERGNLENLRICPVTVQDEIPGTNIRAFVAGDRVLACEIKTDEIDFRDDASPNIVPHDLVAEQQAVCRKIAQTLGLVWTGIDFRLTPDGRYVFLEANPSPMFMGFERYAGLPLTESLAALLLANDHKRIH